MELEDIAIYESEQNDLKEQQMLCMVRKGDTSALRERIASAPAIQVGTLASRVEGIATELFMSRPCLVYHS